MQSIIRRVVALTVLGVVASAGPAGAASSVISGWWTASPVPLAPDVSAEQLLVQGGPDATQPLAYAAVGFELVDGERPQRVVLGVAPSSASTPATRLALCPLRSSAFTAAGGPAADGPTFDCATKVEAAPSADGTAYTFDVSSLPSAASLDVAVVPTAPTDRVVLVRPGTDALQSQSSPVTAATESGSALASPPTVFDPVPDVLAPVFAGAGAVGTGSDVTGATADTATKTAAPAASVGSSFPVAGGGGGSSLRAALLFAVLAVTAAGLWVLAGRQSSPSTASSG